MFFIKGGILFPSFFTTLCVTFLANFQWILGKYHWFHQNPARNQSHFHLSVSPMCKLLTLLKHGKMRVSLMKFSTLSCCANQSCNPTLLWRGILSSRSQSRQVAANSLYDVIFFKISIKTKNLQKKKVGEKKSWVDTNRRRATASDPNEPNYFCDGNRKQHSSETMNPPHEGFLLLYNEFSYIYVGISATFCSLEMHDGIKDQRRVAKCKARRIVQKHWEDDLKSNPSSTITFTPGEMNAVE